jgi:hypothetical protein
MMRQSSWGGFEETRRVRSGRSLHRGARCIRMRWPYGSHVVQLKRGVTLYALLPASALVVRQRASG